MDRQQLTAIGLILADLLLLQRLVANAAVPSGLADVAVPLLGPVDAARGVAVLPGAPLRVVAVDCETTQRISMSSNEMLEYMRLRAQTSS